MENIDAYCYNKYCVDGGISNSIMKIMKMNTQAIKLFETKKVRTAWNEEEEEWYYREVSWLQFVVN